MKKSLQWFKERIGKEVMAKSGGYGYNGKMKITDSEHANYLFYISQKTQGYTFEEIQPLKPSTK